MKKYHKGDFHMPQRGWTFKFYLGIYLLRQKVASKNKKNIRVWVPTFSVCYSYFSGLFHVDTKRATLIVIVDAETQIASHHQTMGEALFPFTVDTRHGTNAHLEKGGGWIDRVCNDSFSQIIQQSTNRQSNTAHSMFIHTDIIQISCEGYTPFHQNNASFEAIATAEIELSFGSKHIHDLPHNKWDNGKTPT